MRLFRLLTLYLALMAGANATLASDTSLETLRDGDMKKLVFHSEPQAVSEAEFTLADGAGMATLADYRGKWVLARWPVS